MSAKRDQWFYTPLGYFVIVLLLVVTASIIGAVVYWMLNHGIRTSKESSAKWVGFGLFTIVLFWWITKQSRRFWRRRFWATTGCLFAIHSAAFLTLFRYVDEWRAFYFFVITTIEAPLMMALIAWSMRRTHKWKSHH